MYKGKEMTGKLEQDSFLSTWNPERSSTVDVAMVHISEMVQKKTKERVNSQGEREEKNDIFIVTGMKWDR